MERLYKVYKHTNKINGKSYIGITCYKNPNSRWEGGSGYKAQPKFYSAIQKYGWDNFTHEIIEDNISKQDIEQKEIYYIQQYDSYFNGYNASPGGRLLGEESCQKISQALKGIKRKEKSIQEQIITKKIRSGFGNGFDPIDTNLTKKVRCIETGDVFGSIIEAENWSNTNKIGECCNKRRQHAGRHPITNEQLSWEFVDKDIPITIRCLEKRKIKKIKKILCLETNKIYNNATEAEKDTNIQRCNISRVCQGKRKTAGGYHWQYLNEEE